MSDTATSSAAGACVIIQDSNISRFDVKNVVLTANASDDLMECGHRTVQVKLKLVV